MAVFSAAAHLKSGQRACPVAQIEVTVFEERGEDGGHEVFNTEARRRGDARRWPVARRPSAAGRTRQRSKSSASDYLGAEFRPLTSLCRAQRGHRSLMFSPCTSASPCLRVENTVSSVELLTSITVNSVYLATHNRRHETHGNHARRRRHPVVCDPRSRGLAAVPRSRRPGSLRGARHSLPVVLDSQRGLESAGSRPGMVVADRGERTRVAHDRDFGSRWRAAARRLRRRVGPRSARRRGLSHWQRRTPEREEQPRISHTGCRRRSDLRALRRRGNRGGHDGRQRVVEDAAAPPDAARQRRLARRSRRSAHRQLRRRGCGVRRRARQEHGEGAMEDVAPAPVVAGVHDAARHSSGRARTARERRRVLRGRLRSAERQGNLACELPGRVLQRAEAGRRARPRLHHDRIPAALADGNQARRQGGRHANAHRLDDEPRRVADAVTAAGW